MNKRGEQIFVMCFVTVVMCSLSFEVTVSLIISFVLFYSLTKDMTGKEDVYRGPAIRALCRITDVSAASFSFLPCSISPSLPLPCPHIERKKERKHPLYVI